MTKARPAVVQVGPDVLIAVRVQPRAARNQLAVVGPGPGDSGPQGITIRLTAPPVAGAANAACCTFVAELLRVPKSRVTIARGETARQKLLRIRGVEVAAVLARLQTAE